MISFYEWITAKYRTKSGDFKNNRFGDLARDAYSDRNFPAASTDKEEISGYLRCRGACGPCMETFEAAWKKYAKEK